MVIDIFCVKSARINPIRHCPDDFSTAATAVAGRTVGVRRASALHDARSMQKIMDQGVHRDHGLSRLEPNRPVPACSDQQVDNAIIRTLSETP